MLKANAELNRFFNLKCVQTRYQHPKQELHGYNIVETTTKIFLVLVIRSSKNQKVTGANPVRSTKLQSHIKSYFDN